MRLSASRTKDDAELHIGYLKCYGGREFRLAVAEFSEKISECVRTYHKRES